MRNRGHVRKELVFGMAFGLLVSAGLLSMFNFALGAESGAIFATFDRLLVMSPFVAFSAMFRLALSQWQWLTERPLFAWPIIGIGCLPILYLSILIREAIVTKQFTESCCYESFNIGLWLVIVVLTILLSLAYGFFQKRVYPSIRT